jgi:transposase
MRPPLWEPPIPLAPAEEQVVRRIRRAQLFVWLRQHRHELFDVPFQEELAALYADAQVGQPPVPPAQLALATLLQAYTGVGDAEVVEATVFDGRWQLVLDCLGAQEAPFSTATLVAFRRRLIAADLDRRLIEQTVQLARTVGGFGDRALRAALDSSPLWGAGRVEDTYNLLGHALRKALGMLARQQGWGLAACAQATGAPLVAGPQSLKAALDLDWDDPAARADALGQVLAALTALETWLDQTGTPAPVSLAVAAQVVAQDVVADAGGAPTLRRGVAPDRRISVEDADMRHGRKSRSRRFDGFKRHVLRDLDSGLVRAVGLTAANAPEASVTPALATDLAAQGATLRDLHIDRAYLSSTLVRERGDGLTVYCKAWPVRNGDRFAKTAFTLDWEQGVLRCPAGVQVPFSLGSTVHFPEPCCRSCLYRDRCTTSSAGRSVHIHPDERLLEELRTRQQTSAGRATLRERVKVEHALAHISHWQGDRARYRGLRKNLFDLRRAAAIHNLFVLRRLYQQVQPAA